MSQEGSSSTPEQKAIKKGIQWGWIVAALIVAVIVGSLFIKGVDGTVHYYMTVSEYTANQPKYVGKRIKIAGHVKAGSLQKKDSTHEFLVEDLGKEIHVRYAGLVPDTFKEGVEVVVEGRGRADSEFEAVDLMAKCASKYQEGGLPPLEQMRTKSVL